MSSKTAPDRRVILARLMAPLPRVEFPDGSVHAVEHISGTSLQLLNACQEEGCGAELWDVVALCVPTASRQAVLALSLPEVDAILAIARRSADVVYDALVDRIHATADAVGARRPSCPIWFLAIRVARAFGGSPVELMDGPFALLALQDSVLRELEEDASVIRDSEELRFASRMALGFHEPKKLAGEARALQARVRGQTEESAAEALARGRALVERLTRGGVMLS